MPDRIFSTEVAESIAAARRAARTGAMRSVSVDGRPREVRVPFPSPGDWREVPIYFLMLDRFNNPSRPPAGAWNRRFDFRQGGTFKGVQAALGYLQELGVGAIWISPVLKNARPEGRWNYHGYGQQDFLNLDARFASDGQLATAERELTDLVDEAHARGLRVILDVVLNHAARIFDYVRDGQTVSGFADPTVMDGALGSEPDVQWLDGTGVPQARWQNRLDPPEALGPDDAIWPAEMQNHLFFRRRGSKLTDDPGGGFVRGDFGDMRQFVVEYDAGVPGQEELRTRYGVRPVLSMLVMAHQYLVARYDFDGFRIDTAKYVDPGAVEIFGNAMREFALTLGKTNFFTFGEIYDDEATIAEFVGRNGGSGDGYGIDAALDFPLFFRLPAVAKGFADVAGIRDVFERRKEQEANLLSTHGEAGRFFVSFLDNHDQPERIRHPQTADEQVTLAAALLFTLQGIPCLYYGTEQGLSGTVDENGNPDLSSNESVREALWGKPDAFGTDAPAFRQIREIARLRAGEPALSFGRLYFREVAGAGDDFGHSFGAGGILAFSRILSDREVLVVANTGPLPFLGSVILDRDLHAAGREMTLAYSNKGTEGSASVRRIDAARFHRGGQVSVGPAAALTVTLGPREIQILLP